MDEKKVQTLKMYLERNRDAKFWGKIVNGNDVFTSKTQGDGQSLMWLTTLESRPWSYYIRVDSSLEDYHIPSEKMDEMEEILSILEGEFGRYHPEDEVEEEDEEKDRLFPVVNTNGGWSWGFEDLSEVFEKASKELTCTL